MSAVSTFFTSLIAGHFHYHRPHLTGSSTKSSNTSSPAQDRQVPRQRERSETGRGPSQGLHADFLSIASHGPSRPAGTQDTRRMDRLPAHSRHLDVGDRPRSRSSYGQRLRKQNTSRAVVSAGGRAKIQHSVFPGRELRVSCLCK